MAADRMSSEQTIMRLHVFKYMFCDEDPLKTSGSFEVFIEKNTLDTACFHDLPACPLTSRQILHSNLVIHTLFLIH